MNPQIERGMLGLRVITDLADAYRSARTLVSRNGQSQMSGATMVVVSFAVGAIAGATVAALFTPITGPALRKRIAKGFDAFRDRIEDGTKKVITSATSAMHRDAPTHSNHSAKSRTHRASA